MTIKQATLKVQNMTNEQLTQFHAESWDRIYVSDAMPSTSLINALENCIIAATREIKRRQAA